MSRLCEEPGCPLLTDGRCLENYDNGVGCPHVREDDSDPSVADQSTAGPEEQLKTPPPPEADAEVEEDVDEFIGQVASEAESAPVELGGDLSMSLAESEAIAARYGARVVLVCGPFSSGKTSLVAGLYGLFLDGPPRGWSFAGSTSLMAIDRRFHAKRAATGFSEPDQAGTREDDMRLLDLRLSRRGRRISLMFSDVRGEYFEDITAGRPVEEAVPLAWRADLAAFVVNGDDINDLSRRAGAMHLMRLLIGGMTESGGLRPDTPFAVVVSKADRVEATAVTWFEQQAEGLVAFAQSRGLGEAHTFVTAAFPDASTPGQTGLEGLLDWMTAPSAPVESAARPEPAGLRTFLRRGADV
jgi:hypothetical protein